MLPRWILSLVLVAGCSGPYVTGSWLTINGAEPCSDYRGISFTRMEVELERQESDEGKVLYEYQCEDGGFDVYLSPGSYWVQVYAVRTEILEEELGWTVDRVVGGSPTLGVEVGDTDVVMAPFLVDVGP
jgi:hypothetical protein